MCFDNEECIYLGSIIKQDYDSIHKFNYKFIPQYIKDYSKDLPFLNDDNFFRIYDQNIIEIINNNIEYKFSKETSNLIVFKLISYILRSEMNFNIELLIEEKYFINIIKRALCFDTKFYISYYKNDLEKVLAKRIAIGEDIISNFVNILYKTNVGKEKFKNEIKLAFRLLAKRLIPDYENEGYDIIRNPLNYEYLDVLKIDLLLVYEYDKLQPINKGLVGKSCNSGINEEFENIIITKFSITQKPFEEPKEKIKNNTKSQELTNKKVEGINTIKEGIEKQKDKDEEYYKAITSILSKWINRGTPENYRSIYENKCLPNNRCYLKIKNNNNRDIMRFANTFELTLEQTGKIFKTKINKKDKLTNVVNEYTDALKRVKKECLERIVK
ncbi:MAG: hypothetical protein H6Q16_2115 [Bacteroidetes bacterium]|nr:hypothetical protein [Bacteroidota bacterium]